MTCDPPTEYQIFKFVTHDWEGDEFAPERQGAPMYGLFEAYRNSKGEIYGRSAHPVLMVDLCFEPPGTDPVALFQTEIERLKQGIGQPILEEPFAYADSEVMTEEEAQAFMAECLLPHGLEEKPHDHA